MATPLSLGPGVISRILPQRRPFLMVDRVLAIDLGAPPSLDACRMVGANDPVFDGHFPDLPMLPGALVLEGLGQACALLSAFTEAWDDEATLARELGALERALTLDPAADGALARRALERLRGEARVGVVGATSLKFVRPVFAGCRLDYRVTLTHRAGEAVHFKVEARVEGEVCVRGTLSGGALRPFQAP